MGFSIDYMSMMGLSLTIGILVDDSIVILENIVRHMEMGKPRMQAAFEGGRQIGFTILSMTLSLAAVFIPVLFMGGIMGRLFHEFAVTISMAILVSGFVSLSLTPMLCSRFLKPPAAERHGRFYLAMERVFDGMRKDRIQPYWHSILALGIIGARGNNGLGVAGVNWDVSMMLLKIGAQGVGRNERDMARPGRAD